KIHGETLPFAAGYTALTLREPHGVTGHIVPWNYPMQIVGRSVGAALAMGNACVLKPAEEACLTVLAFARIAIEAGLPPGAVNAGIQNAGQTCSAASRILVERPVFEKVRAMMAERYRALRVGPAALDLDVGPVISQRQKVVIEHYLGLARDDGFAFAAEGGLV